ncbi:RDD family protein [Candidatus Poriferisodalis sp.]|uniref:RDD family protein n=1 Tax=Candidatus Poriferisodalis sp. TaxID=3101277 RepID=UPI003C6F00B4
MELEPPPGDVSLEDFAAGPFRRLTAHLIEGFFGLEILVLWWLFFPYFLWWLFALARGQSPGKQLTGISAVRRDGSRFGWGRMFLRESVRVLFWTFTFGFGSLADSAAILLRKDRRSITDLVAGSVIVYVPSG